MPSWTWINESEEITEEEIEQRTPLLDALAKRITDMREQAERRQWARQARMEDGDDGPEYDSPDEAEAAMVAETRRRNVESAIETATEDAILAEMQKLGARLMRPYEHWNEDERYMEYMERDR